MEVNLHNLVFGYAILSVLLSYEDLANGAEALPFHIEMFLFLCDFGTSWFMFGKHLQIVYLY